MFFKNLFLRGVCAVVFLLLLSSVLLSQAGNTVSGFVFDQRRQPLAEITVELMDEFSRTIGRTRTNASGRFTFGRLFSGRFKIRTFSVTDYEDQEQEIEIQNVSTTDMSGNTRISGFENAQRDFYLRPRRKNENFSRPDTVFVQEVPKQAQDLYKTGVRDLEGSNENGLLAIKHAIEIFPDYYDALEMLGTEYVKRKHFVPAQILLLKATQVNPRGYKSWYGLSYAFYALNAPKEGLESIEKAIALHPNSIEAALLAGVLSRRAGKFLDAEKYLKHAKSLSSATLPEAHLQLSILYGNELKRYEDAAKELEQYLKASPNLKDKEAVKKRIEEYRSKAR